MTDGQSAFWDDLAQDLRDPEFLREYVAESMRIATVDRIVNELDDARERAGMSKAELARAVGAEPATVRRLFSASSINPTLGTLAEIAAVLGLEVVLAPLPPARQQIVTAPLRRGSSDDSLALAKGLADLRGSGQ